MGGVRFIVGLSKKVILADVLAESVDQIFAMDVNTIPMGMAWFGAIAYTLQIYFDFSGYSDMAIGIGKILGYSFPENFNLPYISKTVREFWRRWHISLSTWFRDYLYIPLGGNRKGNVYVNLFIVFLCTGLWHGASWTFVVWGLWHGTFMIAERLLEKKNRKAKKVCFEMATWFYTMLVAIFGWVIFRSDNLLYSIGYLKAMVGLSTCEFNYINTLYFLNARNIFTLIVAIVLALGVPQSISKSIKNQKIHKYLTITKYPAALLLYGLSLLIVINGNYSPFIYFRF